MRQLEDKGKMKGQVKQEKGLGAAQVRQVARDTQVDHTGEHRGEHEGLVKVSDRCSTGEAGKRRVKDSCDRQVEHEAETNKGCQTRWRPQDQDHEQ